MRPPFLPSRFTPAILSADFVLRHTVRWSVDDPDGAFDRARGGEPMIFACRHGELWPLLWAVRDCQVSVLTSRSGDGELLARVLRAQGFSLLRGSGSKNGSSAVRAALELLRSGGRIGLAVDGPRGPRGVVHDGVLRLAQRTGVAIVPLRRRGGQPWVARGSWDRFEIPRPGERIRVAALPQIFVGPDPAELCRAGDALASALDGFRHRPDRPDRVASAWPATSADTG